MKKLKRTLYLILAILTLVSLLAMPAFAASYAWSSAVTSSHYAKCFTIQTSGKVVPYTSSSLTTRGSVTYGASSTAYIDAAADELYVLAVDPKGVYAKVSYPIGSKRAVAYIRLSAICPTNGTGAYREATKKFLCAKRQGAAVSSSYYVSPGERFYLLGTSGTQTCLLYPINSTTWRIGWTPTSNISAYSKTVGSTTTTPAPASSFRAPMNDYHTRYRQWGVKSGEGDRVYHLGVDFMSDSDDTVYAFGAGTVVAAGEQKANGKFVLISHQIPDSTGALKTVYSFYAHLDSFSVKVEQTVSAGTPIGIVGMTGSSAKEIVHLHFAIISKAWTSGGAYGYATYFTGNKVTYGDGDLKCTYYNPYYVINNGRLP